MVDEDRQPGCRDHKELGSEGVVVRVVGGTELEEDEVAGDQDGQDEDDLHGSVVD